MKNTYYILTETEVLKLSESAYIALHEYDRKQAVHIMVGHCDGVVLSVFNQGKLRETCVDSSACIRESLWTLLREMGFGLVTNGQNKKLAERVLAGENLHAFIAQEKMTD